MVVSKSSNRNELHYAAYVDENCAPATSAPVHAYWVMLERGPGVTEPLSRGEARMLGIASQEVSGGTWVETAIGGARARLLSVYVKQQLFGVDYVLLTGRTAEGKRVEERVSP